ncbi:MucR family transcriptional regulator [Methylobacterium sp. Leaf117]|uniref:MucR family transcriptional regulator n=1 Tax=Methylobacterium sp. Leaf117 TaxID=1736260 RepID=UPI000A443424|nr:MucR family transcriptional regulator [Methylobacterium sp. Leaf117]
MQDVHGTAAETETETGAVDYVAMTADLVSAYISKNSVRPTDLGELITTVHQTLKGLNGPVMPAGDKIEKPTPAEIKKSITPDALISFEDGKPYKTLRRHLTMRGLTPEAYRAKYGLARDYPMTSAAYSAQRSELARSSGLGNHRKGVRKAARPDGTASEAPAEPKQKKAGRAPKAP